MADGFGRVRAALEVSLRAASARLLPDGEDAALILLARDLADEVDYLRDHNFVNRAGKFDNVSVSQLNRCLVELSLTPLARAVLKAPTEAEDVLKMLRGARR